MATKGQNDEFYTQLRDIDNELGFYRAFFRGKTVLCNCGDPPKSNFFQFFVSNFNALGLKKLVATSYAGSPLGGADLPLFREAAAPAHVFEITAVKGSCRSAQGFEALLALAGNSQTELRGNGDFRNEEGLNLLGAADVVVTHPPASLFREFVALVEGSGKSFLALGNQNAITSREIFHLIKCGRLWLGASIHSGDREFRVPAWHDEAKRYRFDREGNKYVRVRAPRWFTNIDYPRRHEDLILWKPYTPDDFPKYDNYEAINVERTSEIPYDYPGAMGVPLTFLDRFNPGQFEILGLCENMDPYGLKTRVYSTRECDERYFELFHKKGTYDLNASAVLGGKKVYQRLLVRHKSI